MGCPGDCAGGDTRANNEVRCVHVASGKCSVALACTRILRLSWTASFAHVHPPDISRPVVCLCHGLGLRLRLQLVRGDQGQALHLPHLQAGTGLPAYACA